MSLLSRDLQSKVATFNLKSLETINGQQGYGVIENTTGTILHVRGTLLTIVIIIRNYDTILTERRNF